MRHFSIRHFVAVSRNQMAFRHARFYHQLEMIVLSKSQFFITRYNTPACYTIYAMGRYLKYTKEKGGLSYWAELSDKKSTMIYDVGTDRPSLIVHGIFTEDHQCQ